MGDALSFGEEKEVGNQSLYGNRGGLSFFLWVLPTPHTIYWCSIGLGGQNDGFVINNHIDPPRLCQLLNLE